MLTVLWWLPSRLVQLLSITHMVTPVRRDLCSSLHDSWVQTFCLLLNSHDMRWLRAKIRMLFYIFDTFGPQAALVFHNHIILFSLLLLIFTSITRDSEVILLPPIVFACLFVCVCVFVTMLKYKTSHQLGLRHVNIVPVYVRKSILFMVMTSQGGLKVSPLYSVINEIRTSFILAI